MILCLKELKASEYFLEKESAFQAIFLVFFVFIGSGKNSGSSHLSNIFKYRTEFPLEKNEI